MLEVKNLNSGYGDIQILWDINLKVDKGEIVTVIGPNGAGKTTLLKTIAGLVKPFKNSGGIFFKGRDIAGMEPHDVVRQGLVLVSSEIGLFPQMTVYENLLLGAYNVNAKDKRVENLKRVFELFPRLEERKNQKAGTLSGGERQMLMIAQGLMADPELLMLDEPSSGLQPSLVTRILDTLGKIRDMGVTILLVEQNVFAALKVADRGYVIENGRIVLQGTSEELMRNQHVKKAYLAI